MSSENQTSFNELGLAPSVLKAVTEVGYETPSPIQAASIPLLIQGRDILGQAQTGTGKTAAFALPLLSKIEPDVRAPQMLVLAPTRELAIQVAEAIQSYSKYMKGMNVLPIYGGQSYEIQLRSLRRGAQVVVGTPGRIMDHLRKGTLKLDQLKSLVLDEADEMLRMGFIEDVEWILEHVPAERQTALFSATLPKPILKVATKYLNNPENIKIKDKTATAKTINQRFLFANRHGKLDALTRILETEPFDATIIFVRTKTEAMEVSEKLTSRGHASEALHGDIAQNAREKVVQRLKGNKIDIIVATDVAARGLDVERITHVINYDIPFNTESYIHRIGRTGRAGRSGEAILFVSPRETRLLNQIERATKQPLEKMQIPSIDDVNSRRVNRFKEQVLQVASNADLSMYDDLVNELTHENDIDPLKLAAAFARMAQGSTPLLMKEQPKRERGADREEGKFKSRESRNDRFGEDRPRKRSKDASELSFEAKPLRDHPDVEMQRFKVAVGYNQGVKPGNIVGAIANEAELESQYIGHIEIFDDFSIVDLPAGMPKDVFNTLKKVRICGTPANLSFAVGEKKEKKKETLKLKGKRKPAPNGKKPAAKPRARPNSH